MKPHISQTLEELRAHQALLGNMILALEAYGRSAEGPVPTALAQPEQSAPKHAGPARGSPTRPRGRSSAHGI